MTNPITTGGTLPSVGYVGPDGTGMATGGQPLPFQLPAPTPSGMPEMLETIKAIAPGIMQALSRRSDATDERAWQEADAARRDSRSQQLVSTSAAIANLAHAIADLKEVKERTEVTGAIAQAALRLANSIQPMPEEVASDGLSEQERAMVLDLLYAQACPVEGDGELERQQCAAVDSVRTRLMRSWGMATISAPHIIKETPDAG